jgi:hypothetical protein
MSLNYELGEIPNYKEVCFYDVKDDEGKPARRMKGVTESLIWLTIPCLFGVITEKNHVEIYRRIHAYEHARGAMRFDKEGNPVYVTLADVKAHIGLRTNVSTESEAAFKRELLARMFRDADNAIAKEQRDANR